MLGMPGDEAPGQPGGQAAGGERKLVRGLVWLMRLLGTCMPAFTRTRNLQACLEGVWGVHLPPVRCPMRCHSLPAPPGCECRPRGLGHGPPWLPAAQSASHSRRAACLLRWRRSGAALWHPSVSRSLALLFAFVEICCRCSWPLHLYAACMPAHLGQPCNQYRLLIMPPILCVCSLHIRPGPHRHGAERWGHPAGPRPRVLPGVPHHTAGHRAGTAQLAAGSHGPLHPGPPARAAARSARRGGQRGWRCGAAGAGSGAECLPAAAVRRAVPPAAPALPAAHPGKRDGGSVGHEATACFTARTKLLPGSLPLPAIKCPMCCRSQHVQSHDVAQATHARHILKLALLPRCVPCRSTSWPRPPPIQLTLRPPSMPSRWRSSCTSLRSSSRWAGRRRWAELKGGWSGSRAGYFHMRVTGLKRD